MSFLFIKHSFPTSDRPFIGLSLMYKSGGVLVEKAFIQLLANNYNKIVNFSGSSSANGGFSVALQYALNGRLYHGLEHESVVKKLRLPMPLGSVIHGYGNDPILLDKIAAKFICEGNVDESIKQLHENIALLKKYKFSSGYNLNYSAQFLKDEEHARLAKQFFDEMKRNQWFLTRKTDYPITVILTRQEHDPAQLANTIYDYYQALKQHLKSGDQLQMLAQFLTYYSPTFEQKLVDYTLRLKEELEAKNIKVKRNNYPLLGLLALNATDSEKLDYIIALRHEILQHKLFKLYPEIALTAAVSKSLTDQYTEEAITGELPMDWTDLLFYSDIFFVIPKTLIEGVLSADFNIFQ